MKKVMSVLLALVMIISCFAAMSVTAGAMNGNLEYVVYYQGENAYLEADYLYDGDGKLSSLTYYSLSGEEKTFAAVCVYTYAEDGSYVMDQFYNEDKAPEHQNRYEAYDANDNMISERYAFDAAGKIYIQVDYAYDENGNLLSRKNYMHNEFAEDEEGKHVYDGDVEYTYDKDGNCLSEIVYSKDGSVYSGEVYELTYDDQGRVSEKSVKDAKTSVEKTHSKFTYHDDYVNEAISGDVEQIHQISYDEFGNVIEEVTLEEKDSTYSTVSKLTWEYDDNGKLLKEVENEVTRVYSYEQVADPTAEEVKASIKIAKQDAEGKADEAAVQAGEGFAMHIGEDTNIAPANLKAVLVDGQAVDAKYYTVEKGSIIVNFTEEYTKTLSNGNHNIQFQLQKGIYEGVILDASVTITGGTPKTGDAQNMLIYMTVAIISAAAVVLIIRKKRTHC